MTTKTQKMIVVKVEKAKIRAEEHSRKIRILDDFHRRNAADFKSPFLTKSNYGTSDINPFKMLAAKSTKI